MVLFFSLEGEIITKLALRMPESRNPGDASQSCPTLSREHRPGAVLSEVCVFIELRCTGWLKPLRTA
jgi:hypothetical protein